eukprot:3214571-Lingulodinium_polyedra.AAC.1
MGCGAPRQRTPRSPTWRWRPEAKRPASQHQCKRPPGGQSHPTKPPRAQGRPRGRVGHHERQAAP